MKGSEEYVIQKLIEGNYENLAMAIVKQAADDLKLAIRRAQRVMSNGDSPAPSQLLRIKELEEFFDSDWYKTLCSLDGKRIVKMIKKEMEWCYDEGKA